MLPDIQQGIRQPTLTIKHFSVKNVKGVAVERPNLIQFLHLIRNQDPKI